MEKDKTLFGTQAIANNNNKVVILYTYQNKYDDTDWFTMAMTIDSDCNKKAYNLDELTIVE